MTTTGEWVDVGEPPECNSDGKAAAPAAVESANDDKDDGKADAPVVVAPEPADDGKDEDGAIQEGDRSGAVDGDGDGDGEKKPEVTPPVGAGLLFGLGGFLLGGPLVAMLTGCGAATVAKYDEGAAGDATRQTGDFAIRTGKMAGEKARELDEGHGFLEKVQNVVSCGWAKVKEFDEEHKTSEKVKGAVDNVKQKAAEFDEKHQVTEKTKEKAGAVAQKTKEKAGAVAQKTREFEEKHHVGETIMQGIQNGVNFIAEKWKEMTGGGEQASDGVATGNGDQTSGGDTNKQS